ncbi:HAMP domain-containing histidine kinase [Lachnospiraceae bacterium DSM 108991]|uniref:histidine kinase n=1 Tax=Claveliimonas monacensis TaxID=2779351 RepID=A0ABR9RI02_9FIRM|nr:HAMP domain-containing sensor histidine kinase [Claveliimonas monacensis]MBE5062599.1 HAMP domain-containing histidine kinase [Claveliimonas monacensis]
MATRLKNMIKSAAEKLKSVSVWAKTAFVLWLLGGAVSAFAAYRFIYQHNFYIRWYSISYSSPLWATYALSLGLLAGAALAAYLYLHFFRSRADGWKKLKVRALDQLNAELLLAAAILTGFLWVGELRSVVFQSESLAGFFVFYGLESLTLGCALLFFPLALLFLGCLILLIRRRLLGIWGDTSWICRLYRRWQKSTPFEKQLRTKYLLSFTLMAGGILLGIVCFYLLSTWYGADELIILGLISEFLTFLAAAWALNNRLYTDLGQLLGQIGAMAGGDLSVRTSLDARSDLYPASCQLGEISESLQTILDKQMRAERMKIDLITNVSHDLKTPLTSMIGYVDLLKQEPLSDAAQDYVEVLSSRMESLKDMIQDIFDLSKSTSGTAELHLETLDMKKLLEQTLGDMEDAIKSSDMVIREAMPEMPLKFTGDGKKMYRVLQNLIGNALKYSLAGTRIYIIAERRASQVQVTIKNTAAYEMDFTSEEIMERFARGDKSRNTEGHGLGLAIAESFVKNMKGGLQVTVDGDQFKVQLTFPVVEETRVIA